MTAVEMREIAIKTARAALKEAGCREGDILTNEEIVQSSATVFYNKRVADTSPGLKKETFITWNLISTDATGYADNRVAVRSTYLAIDVFTRKAESDSDVTALLRKIENAFIERGWQFEQVNASNYDKVFNLTQLPYAATLKM